MQILRKDPKSPVFAILSEAYRKGGLLDEAIATAVEGLKHNPNYISGRVALGRAYFDKGEMDNAAEELKKVIKATPDNLISHKLIAEIYIKKSDIPAAVQELKTVVYLSPDDKESKKLLDTLSKPRPAAEPPPQPAEAAPQEIPAGIPQEAGQEPAVPEPAPPEAPHHGQPEEQPAPVMEHLSVPQGAEPRYTVDGQLPGPAAEPVPPAGQSLEPVQVSGQEHGQPVQQATEPLQAEEQPTGVPAEAMPSIDSELESALNSPLEESKPEPEAAAPGQERPAFSQPRSAEQEETVPSEEQVPRETELQKPEVQPGPAVPVPEPKDQVKEEELEAVFDNLTEIAQTPSEHPEPPVPAQTSSATVQTTPAVPFAPETAFQPEPPPPAGVSGQTPPVEAPVPVEQNRPSELHGEDIQTVTMADLYIKQGHLEKAYHIYRTILLKSPDSPLIRAKLVKVKKLMEAQQQEELDRKKLAALKEREPKPPAAEQSDTMKENMKRLNAWLEKIKKGG